MLGATIRIKLNRDYGPYLDDRPMLREGVYEAVVDSISPSSGESGLYLVRANNHVYTVQSKDTTLI